MPRVIATIESLSARKFKTRSEAMKADFDHIELFYNRRRIHSCNGYLSPIVIISNLTVFQAFS